MNQENDLRSCLGSMKGVACPIVRQAHYDMSSIWLPARQASC
jgi:hypothetical protein